MSKDLGDPDTYIPQKLPLSVRKQLVHCISCSEPLVFVYSHAIGDRCDLCGGKSKYKKKKE